MDQHRLQKQLQTFDRATPNGLREDFSTETRPPSTEEANLPAIKAEQSQASVPPLRQNQEPPRHFYKDYEQPINNGLRTRIEDALGWFPLSVYSDAKESEPDESDWESDVENPNFYPDYPESNKESDQEQWEFKNPDFYTDYPEQWEEWCLQR
ncbi:unnamed protein product [Caenorhabditis brenneri]